MCGIYGIAKSPVPYTKKQLKTAKKVLREIAIDSETRGSHSSGIASVGLETKIYKSLLKSSKFVTSKDYTRALSSIANNSSQILLGHTRFATEGAISVQNAHPFKVGGVVGAHNGCVYNIDEMKTKLNKDCPVDSQLIFKSIDKADGIQDAIKYFDSDFALSFVKDNPQILHLCREDNRPLFVAYVTSLKTLFYASEGDFIEDALIMAGINDVEVYQLSKNNLYSYNVNQFTDENTNVTKTSFDYESRVYKYYTLNSYVNNITLGSDKDSVDNINPSSGNGQYDYSWIDNDGVWHDGNNEIDQNALDNDKYALISMYGGNEEDWIFDQWEKTWYYIMPDGALLSIESVEEMENDGNGIDSNYEDVKIKQMDVLSNKGVR